MGTDSHFFIFLLFDFLKYLILCEQQTIDSDFR